MRRFPSEQALVAAYWRKLARSAGAGSRTRNRVSASHAVALQRRARRAAARLKTDGAALRPRGPVAHFRTYGKATKETLRRRHRRIKNSANGERLIHEKRNGKG
jgi:hypothetical protein